MQRAEPHDASEGRALRILFVINSLGASGAEHSTAALLPELRRLGHSVAVATLFDAGFGDEDRVRSQGFDVKPLGSGRFLTRVRDLRRVIQAFQPDIVHTALYDSDQLGRVAAWRTGRIVVSSLVSTPYDAQRLRDPAIRPWKLRAAQLVDSCTARFLTDRLHAVSPGVADANARALRVPRSKAFVVERGRSREQLGVATAERRAEVRSRLGISADRPVVLSAGRQEHAKAHADLVRAVDLLLKRMPDVVVLLAGREGNASSDLQAALSQHPRASNAIRLLGHRLDIPDLLVAADALLISSRYEGTAGVAIEAMALRCPVVCTDLAGIRGILANHDNAILVPLDDLQAMADATELVLTDPRVADALRDRGLADFEARFTVRGSAERLAAIYQHLVTAGRGAVAT